MFTAMLVVAASLAASPQFVLPQLLLQQQPKTADKTADKKKTDDPLPMFPAIPKRLRVRAKPPANLEEGFKALNLKIGDELIRAKTPADKLMLAGRLANLAAENYNDSALCWAALRESMRLSAESGNPFAVFRAFAIADQWFEFDVIEERFQAMQDMAKNSAGSPPAVQQLIAKASLFAAKEAEARALEAEDYEEASNLIDLATQVSIRIKDNATRDQAARYRVELKKSKEGFDEALTFKKKLEAAPDDIEASLAWGKYLALERRQWNEGLPLMAKAVGTTLGDLARDDLAVKRFDYNARCEMGDRWWKQSDADRKVPAREIEGMRLRAAMWYTIADAWKDPGQKKTGETRIRQMKAHLDAMNDGFSEGDFQPGLSVQTFNAGNNDFGKPVDEPTVIETVQPLAIPAGRMTLITGYIKIDTVGEYKVLDRRSQKTYDLMLNGQRLIRRSTQSQPPATMRLARGVYPFTMYLYSGETKSVDLSFLRDGVEFKPEFVHNPNVWPKSGTRWTDPGL